MSRSWKEIRDELDVDERLVEEHRTRMMAEVRAYRLAEIRKAHSLTQEQVAREMGVQQTRVSQIERGEIDRSEISTLRAYIEALGGHLELIADFGKGSRVVVG
jgi:DNA-binding XRE family transcriptional regulator